MIKSFYQSLISVYLFTVTGIVTIAFAQGLLTPIIDAFIKIVQTAFETILSFLLILIAAPINLITTIIERTPTIIKIELSLLLACCVLIFDHYSNTMLFAEDEVLFFPFIILGKKYWVTLYALVLSAFVMLPIVEYLFQLFWKGFIHLFDRTINVSVTVHR